MRTIEKHDFHFEGTASYATSVAGFREYQLPVGVRGKVVRCTAAIVTGSRRDAYVWILLDKVGIRKEGEDQPPVFYHDPAWSPGFNAVPQGTVPWWHIWMPATTNGTTVYVSRTCCVLPTRPVAGSQYLRLAIQLTGADGPWTVDGTLVCEVDSEHDVDSECE